MVILKNQAMCFMQRICKLSIIKNSTEIALPIKSETFSLED
jgi:hypothetical protein